MSDTSPAPAQPKKREKRPPKKITARYLHNAGLAYLQRFPASSGHFRTILMRKVDKSCRHHKDQNREDCAKLVDETIEKFQELGLLNDEAYLRGMVNSLRKRGLSAAAITAKLMAKKLPGDHIREALNTHNDEGGGNDLEAAILLTRRKKIGAFRPSSKEENRDKELAALARAGFSYEIAGKALSMDEEEAQTLLHALH